MIQTAIEILVDEMVSKNTKILGGNFTYNGKKYKLYLEEVKELIWE
jgi:hypothetical protein